ncbi:uncharacterized protein HMPREF1541_01911 [Cyphellophora europaea CBS 101466]|uniref:Mid2 domain-containing protein n=1 Tax=Cyphellophora europaea (strain CBS 101466) TaxID=1220924 RepID=W2S3X3_CYPE1|nr:uncharacterized protein HMPREF1541_01911 [Cyphellophora europaea CBS 101466]ETN42753.1 hypothetical protein HMPREF1541_01911 [Cyphellophora europaea CBS 101466]
MRQALLLTHSLLLATAVRAFPFHLEHILHVEARHVSVIEKREPQGLLDSLASIGDEISSAFNPNSGATTATLGTGSIATASSSDDDDDDDDDDETTTSRATATRTTASSSASRTTSASTRRTTSTEESSTTESSTSESSTTPSSTSETTDSSTTSSTTTSIPAETARASETPAASSSGSSSSVPLAGIVIGAVGGALLLGLIIFVLLKWGPLAKWRENRAYEKMMERTYRPALDDKSDGMGGFDFGGPGGASPTTAGLGLAPAGVATVSAGDQVPPNGGYRGMRPATAGTPVTPMTSAGPQRAFSFSEVAGAEQEKIRRKPLPTIGTGGGVQASPMAAGLETPTGPDRAEPWLPGGAK